jgi:hypothetical protein
MQISDLRRTARDRLVSFAWDEWAQMGVSASAGRVDRSAQDPEALLLFTFEVARDDPPLFGEVLDWLALNERLVSVQRLRNLCRDDADRTLAEAALSWVAHSNHETQRRRRPAKSELSPAVQLFRDVKADPKRADAAFRAHGWLMPPAVRSGKSQVPNLQAPINFRVPAPSAPWRWRAGRGGAVSSHGTRAECHRPSRHRIRRLRQAQHPRGASGTSLGRRASSPGWPSRRGVLAGLRRSRRGRRDQRELAPSCQTFVKRMEPDGPVPRHHDATPESLKPVYLPAFADIYPNDPNRPERAHHHLRSRALSVPPVVSSASSVAISSSDSVKSKIWAFCSMRSR